MADPQRGPDDGWTAGAAYEDYMGRWSRLVAREFLAWLGPAPGRHWMDVGCGTGALTSAICALAAPASVVACDPSEPFLAHARAQTPDARVSFVVGRAGDPPRREGGFDLIVSGLVLNFVPEPERVAVALRERLGPGGTLAAYVWDYAGRMDLLRLFWDEAAALDPRAAALDEGPRFPLCQPGALAVLLRGAGLADVETSTLEVATDLAGFDDFWRPFLGGVGPAPSYVKLLDDDRRAALEERLRRRLPVGDDGRVHLRARAWTVRGTRP